MKMQGTYRSGDGGEERATVCDPGSGGMGRKEEYVTPDQDVCLGRRRKQEANTINEMRPKKYIHIFGCLEGIYIY